MNSRINPNVFLKTLEEEFRNKSKELNLLEQMLKKAKEYFAGPKEEHYHNLGVSGAIRRFLMESGNAPKSTREISDELLSYGIYSKSTDLYNNINATLHKMHDVEKSELGWKLK